MTMYPLNQTAALFKTTRQTLMAFVRKEQIPYTKKFGKQIYFTDEHLKVLCQRMNYPYEILLNCGGTDRERLNQEEYDEK